MTISHSKFVMSKPTKADLNGEVIEIFHQSPIQQSDAALNRAEAAVARSKKTLSYGICTWVDKVADKLGATVRRIPPYHSGVSSETSDDELEQIGTLLRQGKKWYVETDLEKIEILRRDIEVRKMRDKRLSIGKWGNNYLAYAKYLSERDQNEGRMITRGHGLDGYYLD